MNLFWIVPLALAVGGFATSYVEYRKAYNLYDLLKDKILGLIASIKGKL